MGVSGFVLPFFLLIRQMCIYLKHRQQKMLLAQAGVEFAVMVTVFPEEG